MQARFNPPPNWPPPPPGWIPPTGWVPPPDWPPAPPGWQWWFPESRHPPTSRQKARLLLAIGCAGLALAPFLTWANVALLGSLNLFQIYSASGDPAILPWLVVLSAVAAGILTLSGAPAARIFGIVVGFAAGGLGTLWGVALTNSINHADGFASIGIGPFVEVAGAVAMIIAGFRMRR